MQFGSQCIHESHGLLFSGVVQEDDIFVATLPVCAAAPVDVRLDAAHEIW
jgi:hypothetical protein